MYDNIKVDIKEIDYDDVDWTHLAWDRVYCRAVMNPGMSLRVP